MKVLDYEGLKTLGNIIKKNIIFRDTKENVLQAIKDGILDDDMVVIITDDTDENNTDTNTLNALLLEHNSSTISHEDIRNLINDLSEQLNAFSSNETSFAILNYNTLSDSPPTDFIFKDTTENVSLALSEGKLPDGTIVITTDD